MKKAWNVIRKIIVWAIVVFSLGMMAFTIISVTTFDRADRSVFGYSAFIVLSDSMKATDFDAGDLVIIKQTDPSTLKVGDIISFQSPDETNYGEIVTHKIREITTDEEGHPGFITYGTTTDSNDQGIVTYNLVLGKYQGHIPNVGTFFQFLKTVPGYFICIFTPFFILILVQARNSIKLFRKYKREQMEEIQAEKKSLEEERVRSQEMMEQLMQMQQAMEKNGGQLPPEYLVQMQAAQAAKAAADVSQPEPQQPSPSETPAVQEAPAQQTASIPEQAAVPKAPEATIPPVSPERPTAPVPPVRSAAQERPAEPNRPVPQQRPASPEQAARPAMPQRPAAPEKPATPPPATAPVTPAPAAPQKPAPQTPQRPASAAPQQRPAAPARSASRAGFDVRSIAGEKNDPEQK